MPSRKLLILALACAVALPLTVATASGGTPGLFARGVPVCKTPKHPRLTMTCDAMRRVFVKAGTPGARPFTPLSATLGASATKGLDLTIGPAGGLTPLDLWTAYALSTASTHTSGSTQTLAIVDAYNDPHIAADLATFDTHYGLAPCTTVSGCLRVVNQTGGATPPANDTSGWSVEETLDVESAHAICQGCKIVLLEAASPSNANLATAVNTAVNTFHATEVSNSYGGVESAATSTAYTHPGVVITASTGDHGYYDFDTALANGTTGPSAPQDPAAFPSVVAVGGTSLYLTKTGTRRLETVWNDDGPQAIYEQMLLPYIGASAALGASGGGCSTLAAAPTWQTSLPNWSSTGCGTHRLPADVSAIADPLTGFDIYDSFQVLHQNSCTPPNCWLTLGGTSLASPVVAAIFALAGGAHGVADPASTLYANKADAYDVTVGGNGICDGEGAAQCGNYNIDGYGTIDCDYTGSGALAVGDTACDAGPGYDGPSGVGAPKGLTMFTP